MDEWAVVFHRQSIGDVYYKAPPSVNSGVCDAFRGPCGRCECRQYCSHICGAWLGVDSHGDHFRGNRIAYLISDIRVYATKG